MDLEDEIKDLQMRLSNMGGRLQGCLLYQDQLKEVFKPIMDALESCDFDDIDLGGALKPAYRQTMERLEKLKL